MTKTDPLAEALLAAKPRDVSSGQNKVIKTFGDRPAVLENIVKAHVENKLTPGDIAAILSGDDVIIRTESVKGFLASKGVLRK